MNSIRKIAPLFGVLGSVFWVCLAFYPPVCAPVTETYEVLCNRLWTPALAGMLMGFGGFYGLLRPVLTKTARGGVLSVLAGLFLMIGGNFSEYWIFYNLPHQGQDGFLRGLLWMAVLSGWLLALVGSLATGVALLRSSSMQKWLSLVLILVLPVTLAIGAIAIRAVGIPLGGLGLLAAGYGLASRSRAVIE